MNEMYLVLGDWSDDGHGISEKILVKVNKTIEEVQNAYKNSCMLTGISFNHNDDFTNRRRDWRFAEKFHVATGYENDTLTEECIEVLQQFECPEELLERAEDHLYEAFIDLWFWFVSLSLPDLQYEKVTPEPDPTPVINGFWNENLNVQFGYGLYQ